MWIETLVRPASATIGGEDRPQTVARLNVVPSEPLHRQTDVPDVAVGAVRAANAPCCRAAEQVRVGLAEHPVPGGLVERIVRGSDSSDGMFASSISTTDPSPSTSYAR